MAIGAGWYALIGPLVGGLQVALVSVMAGRDSLFSLDKKGFVTACLLVGMSYVLGLIPAMLTGLGAGLMSAFCRTFTQLIFVSAMATTLVACLIVACFEPAVWLSSGLFVAVFFALPASAAAWALWTSVRGPGVAKG